MDRRSTAAPRTRQAAQAPAAGAPSRRDRGEARAPARQRDAEVPADFLREDADAPAVRLGELARDGEAEPRSGDRAARLRAAAEERIEDRFALLLGHPGAAVDDVDLRLLAARAQDDRNQAA